MRFIDLSLPLDTDTDWAGEDWAVCRVERHDHAEGAKAIHARFGLEPKHLRSGQGWAVETLHLSTHGTTHFDAPWHFAPTSEGKPSKTIDQVPLEWCYGPGLVVDMRHKPHGEAITAADIEKDLKENALEIREGTIVLIMTGNDRRFGTPEYFTHGTGMSREATLFVLDHGVKVTGIDSWGWDIPLPLQAERAKQTGRGDLFWEGHFVGLDREYCHMERLTNLDKLPRSGFTLCCFPLKVAGGSAGPARVVAIVP